MGEPTPFPEAPPQPQPVKLAERLAKVEGDLAYVIWLHAELMFGLKMAAAMQIAAQMAPHLQQQVVDQIMRGEQPSIPT